MLIAGLVALIAAQALKKSIEASDLVLIVLSVLIGAGVAALYARADPVRSFLRVLSPVPVIFLCLFLFTDPISKVAFPDEAQARTIGGVSQAPIVVVLLDELPSNTLIGENDKLDTKRFPGFGELARNATWFRNAYTVYDSTERAQPAIMDGDLPAKDKLPTSADHPNSIFALFGKTHRMNVSEEATTVCSRDLCEDQRLDESYPKRMKSMTEDLGLVWLHVVSPPDMEADLTSVSENWGNFGGASEEGPGPRQHRPRAPHAREPQRRPRGALRGVDREHQAGPAAVAQLQALAAAARALAVPARHAPLPPPGQRPDPGPVEPVLQVAVAAGRAAPAPLPPDRLRRPRCSRTCGST